MRKKLTEQPGDSAVVLQRVVRRQIWEKHIPIPTTVEEVERAENLLMYRSREARSLCRHYEVPMIVKRCSLCYQDFKACPKCNESVCPDCEMPNVKLKCGGENPD